MNETERLDSLPSGNLRIWQDEKEFSFTTDAVFLAAFPHMVKKACVLELGCGTGAISLLAANRGAQSVLAVDKNPHVIELLKRSVRENGLEQQVMPFVGDILAYREYLKPDTMDLVYMNPPYRIGGRRRQLMTEACHEVGVTLEDFIKAAAFALNTRGRLAMVQLPDRFTDGSSFLTGLPMPYA
ncbi:tRNA1(Val) (adenine(37)-N6)-methyltransferase [Acidaminococcus intestini]|uniref:tRNA1(Val) (adenine(37)-N6)-methyltransferase n=1 Tax=Acidaminococcus intestini TaxID=187327 RepID=UPI000336FEDB|nr:methyltransferase [Acidaminococcus intestini]CDB92496.1 methyltransferase [Acidaminococcus intestini CAG:325]